MNTCWLVVCYGGFWGNAGFAGVNGQTLGTMPSDRGRVAVEGTKQQSAGSLSVGDLAPEGTQGYQTSTLTGGRWQGLSSFAVATAR